MIARKLDKNQSMCKYTRTFAIPRSLTRQASPLSSESLAGPAGLALRTHVRACPGHCTSASLQSAALAAPQPVLCPLIEAGSPASLLATPLREHGDKKLALRGGCGARRTLRAHLLFLKNPRRLPPREQIAICFLPWQPTRRRAFLISSPAGTFRRPAPRAPAAKRREKNGSAAMAGLHPGMASPAGGALRLRSHCITPGSFFTYSFPLLTAVRMRRINSR